MSRPRVRRAIAWGVLAAALLAGARRTGAQTDVPAVQRLHLASFGLAEHVERFLDAEHKRLESICRGERGCGARQPAPGRRRIATLQADPAAQSLVVGYVVARVAATESGSLEVALDIERATGDGGQEVWMASVGDWGYGIHVAGVRPRGDWLQLAALPLVGDAWTLRDGPDWSADVDPLVGHIVDIQPVTAMFPDGSSRLTERGSYIVTDVNGDRVSFRAEVDSDMGCIEGARPPAVLPPVLRAPAAELFGPDGSPRFATKYQRGC